ncbi:hypothetical protein CEXT_453741 [Caerostris extrusa]|uniref:Uncharacterized protein n=1 Tax=Caerostris extrusa TaxID=172846 RepID=A0AAV4TIG5_CAEEX|nr:hypothetical protein CEXT_453741 [Caerostris extrusa]
MDSFANCSDESQPTYGEKKEERKKKVKKSSDHLPGHCSLTAACIPALRSMLLCWPMLTLFDEEEPEDRRKSTTKIPSLEWMRSQMATCDLASRGSSHHSMPVWYDGTSAVWLGKGERTKNKMPALENS